MIPHDNTKHLLKGVQVENLFIIMQEIQGTREKNVKISEYSFNKVRFLDAFWS